MPRPRGQDRIHQRSPHGRAQNLEPSFEQAPRIEGLPRRTFTHSHLHPEPCPPRALSTQSYISHSDRKPTMNRTLSPVHRIYRPTIALPGARLVLAAIACVLLTSACAQHAKQGPKPMLHGIVGQQLVGLDPSLGVGATLLTSPALLDLGALTYAADCDCFYAVVGSTHDPVIMRLDPRTGITSQVAEVRVPDLHLSRVEALAWNPEQGLLYAAGGASTFASNRLLSVDPSTGKVKDLGLIEGTVQGEADALTFAGGKLLAIDSAAQISQLYALDLRPGRVRARPLGSPFAGDILDMEYDPDRSLLLAVEATAGRLLTLDLEGRLQADGDPTTANGAAGPHLSGLALVRGRQLVPTSIFGDGFESGTIHLWSDARQGQEKEGQEKEGQE